MASARSELLCIDDEDIQDDNDPLAKLDSPTELLALPAPTGGKRRRASTKAAAKTDGRIQKSQAVRKAVLLAWIARLRYLHTACSHPLLQAVALSVWGGYRLSSPSLPELLERFKVSVLSKSVACGTPLLDACHAARSRKGTPTQLAICFVALCRALDIPARLVLALDPNEGSASASTKASRVTRKPYDRHFPGASATLPDSPGGCAQSCAPPHEREEVIDLEDNDSSTYQKQLEAMGFSRDVALSALLQSEQEEASDILSRATEILLEYDSKPNNAGQCKRCGKSQVHGSFCENCGQRVKPGDPSGAADSQKTSRSNQDEEDEQLVVTAWPEAYDLESGRWVAVDLMFGFLAADPRVEWMHRGVPMLWVCSADDGLRGTSGHCILRDVTARYSPSWWRVEQARGNRSVQRWWEEVALHSMSTWQPMQLALVDDSVCQVGVVAAEIAADADERDVEALKARRNSDAMPTTKSGMKHHKRYVLKDDLGRHTVLKPGAKVVNLLAGTPVYLRSDVVRALTAAQWQKLGRRPKQGEEPCKSAKVRASGDTNAKLMIGDGPLFAEWQTEVEDGLVLRSDGNMPGMKQRGFRKIGKAFKAFVAAKSKPGHATSRKRKIGKQKSASSELSLPALPAPKKEKKKAKPALKLAFRMPAFKEALQKLNVFLDDFGFLPFERGSTAKERHLGLWVRKVIIAYSQRRLSQEQISMLESLEQWDWGDAEGGPAMPEEEPSHDSASKSEGKGGGRKADAGFAGDSDQHKVEQKEKDNSMQQWSQLTMQRLASQLAKQPDMMARRACLRTWQRIYHPDKNPGRADEVLPIFRWVQSAWDQQFRTNDSAAVSEASPKAPPTSRCSAPGNSSSKAAKKNSAPAPPQEALGAPTRKRITGKRPARDL